MYNINAYGTSITLIVNYHEYSRVIEEIHEDWHKIQILENMVKGKLKNTCHKRENGLVSLLSQGVNSSIFIFQKIRFDLPYVSNYRLKCKFTRKRVYNTNS